METAVITVVSDLGGQPESLKLLSSLKTLISSLVSSDNAFATEVAQIVRTTQAKNKCTDEALLQTMGMLEIELASQAQEDEEERIKRGQPHHTVISAMGNLPRRGKQRRGKEHEKGRMRHQETTKGVTNALGSVFNAVPLDINSMSMTTT